MSGAGLVPVGRDVELIDDGLDQEDQEEVSQDISPGGSWIGTWRSSPARAVQGTAPLVHRRQNVAIGLTGLPDVPAKRTGATARWKSH